MPGLADPGYLSEAEVRLIAASGLKSIATARGLRFSTSAKLLCSRPVRSQA